MMDRIGVRPFVLPLLVAIGAWLVGFLCPVLADTGAVTTLPQAGAKIRTRLRLDIDTRWVDGTGYRPVRVRVSPLPPGPAPADRKIEVTLRPRGWYSAGGVATSEVIELPQGERFVEQTIAVPQYESWSNMDVEVREDGRRCPDLSADYLGTPIRNYYNWSEASPSILVVAPDVPAYRFDMVMRNVTAPNSGGIPDVRALVARLPLNYWSGAVDQNTFDLSRAVDDFDLMRLLNDLPRITAVPQESLPDHWIEYTCADVIILSYDELRRLASAFPAKFAALRDWLATGPILVVYGVGGNFEQLGEVEELLEIGPVEAPVANTPRGWHEPSRSDLTSQIKQLSLLEANAQWYQSQPASRNARRPPAPVPDVPFLWREVDHGRLVAMADANPFPGQQEHWGGVFNAVGGDSWMWYRRHGLSMQRENRDYWMLMIPGVGKAPVASFLLLISLFVVVIGPVNYYFLQRSGRLYLLLLTVPTGAFLVTVSLVFYALTTDGLGVRSRTRSFTEIDQREGRAVAWSRQSYYAGLAPSSGMSYPMDAAVYPVEHEPESGRRMNDSSRRLTWTDRQRLTAGYLTTRSTRQFLVVESRPCEFGLDVDETSQPPRVTNRLGVDIERLVLRGADEQYYETARLPSDATVSLVPVDPREAAKAFTLLLGEHRPAYPVGFDPSRMEDFSDFFPRNYYYGSNADDRLSAPSFTSSLPERRIRTILGRNLEGLRARSYLAHVVDSPEVSRGLKNARAEADFHLLHGSW